MSVLSIGTRCYEDEVEVGDEVQDAVMSMMTVAQHPKAEAQHNRSESIEELFAVLESPLLCYALRLVHEISIAEDMVQEAFMKLHAQFSQVKEPRRWLYCTVHNLSLNHQRDSKKIIPLNTSENEETFPAQDYADLHPLPDEQIARLEGIGLVRLSLRTLDERSREIVHLKFNEDLSYQQISERTGLTVGHVGYLLHHALKAIGAELSKSGMIP